MTFEPITVWVAGVPKGQPRGRAFAPRLKDGSRGKPRIHTSGTAEAWKGDIALAFRDHMPAEPIATPCALEVDIFFKRPGRLNRKKDPDHPLPYPAKPDWDNAGKAISDALEHCGVLADDKLICFATVRQWYAAKSGRSGAVITLRPVDQSLAWLDTEFSQFATGTTSTRLEQ